MTTSTSKHRRVPDGITADVGSTANFDRALPFDDTPVLSVQISGEAVRLAVVPDTDFRPIDHDTATEFRAALNKLTDATEVVQTIADRLMDPLDGDTTRGVRALITHRNDLDPVFFDRARGYLYGLLAAGSTLEPARGAVIIPPVTREELSAVIARIPALREPLFDTTRWLDHLYDPRPNIGQGFYLFKSPRDWERFIEALVEASPTARRAIIEVQKIFNDFVGRETLPAELRVQYDALSRVILAEQENFLSRSLEHTEGANDPLTRVYLEVRSGSEPRLKPLPFSSEFGPELMRLSGLLLTAEALLPPSAHELRATLVDQAAWCSQPSESPHWGQPSTVWIGAHDPGAVLDIQVDWAETVALLGDKRSPQMIVAQHLPPEEAAPFAPPPPVTPHLPTHGVPESHLPLVRALAIGGTASHGVVSPEKMIDAPADPELPPGTAIIGTIETIKRPIFTNVTPLEVMHDAGALAASDTAQGEALKNAALIAAQLRESSHTDTSTQLLGGDTGELTAHGYALTGAIARAVTAPPASVEPLLDILVGYEAVKAVRANLEGTQERATIGVISELIERKALSVDASPAGLRVVSGPPHIVIETARALQNKLQLWQIGIPKSVQPTISKEDIDRLEPHLLIQAGWSFARSLDQLTRRRLREEARREVELFFGQRAHTDLADAIRPLVDLLPSGRLCAVMVSDPALRGLLLPEEDLNLSDH